MVIDGSFGGEKAGNQAVSIVLQYVFEKLTAITGIMGDRRCFSAVDGISVVSYGMGGLNLLIESEVIEIFQFKSPWTVSLGIKSASEV